MALEFSTVGAKVKYCWETTSGTRPTASYTELPNVNTAPELNLSPELIDASDISDYITRYIAGRQDPGGDMEFTLNHTEAVITAWNALVADVDTKRAAGLQLWWEYVYPGATNSYFWAGYPLQLGTSGIEQNALSTIPAHVVLTDWKGWQTASTTPSPPST